MSPPAPARRGHRLGFPLAVVGLAAAGIAALQAPSELERGMRFWGSVTLTILALLLLLLWFIFLSRFPWRPRLLAALLLGAVGLALSLCVRIDGTATGSSIPRFAWKWSPPRTGDVPSPPAAPTPTPSPAGLPRIPDVPQFFGAARDGQVRGVRLARDWTTEPPRELWRQPIGLGWSSFSVAGGRAYTQEQRGPHELVTCYEALTGRLLWAHTNLARFSEWQGGVGPRATPTVDRGRVFALGATGILDCLDADTGRRLWTRNVLVEYQLPNLMWGLSASPLLLDDAVIVTGGLTNGPTLLAFDRATGHPLWKAGTDKASYASPIAATLAGRRVVVSVNAASLTLHDPATGTLLLDHPWPTDKWPKASQPVVIGSDRLFLSAGYGVGCVLLQLAAQPDGRFSASELWRNRLMKTQFNSTAVRDGHLYGLDDGLLACMELQTGRRVWKDGRYGAGQSLLVEDLLLVQTEPGAVVLVEASPERFLELARLPALSSKTWNVPTLAGPYLLVRNDREAVCYRLPLRAD